MKGSKQRSEYTDNVLVKEGYEEGSSITMTENAHMTDEEWKETTTKLVEGYRKMPVIQDNLNWCMIEIFDGFVVHLCNLEALKIHYDANILYIKVEVDTSHVKKTCNILVANNYKAVHMDSIG